MTTGRCPHCRQEIDVESRIMFRDVCDHCRGDLHCCLACAYYEPDYHNQCRETRAEATAYKERGNRCDWFQWRGAADAGGGDPAAAARAALEALFKPKS